jgi:hypothetical protein
MEGDGDSLTTGATGGNGDADVGEAACGVDDDPHAARAVVAIRSSRTRRTPAA